jgi:hypothetical protein
MNYKAKVREIYPKANWIFEIRTSNGEQKILFRIFLTPTRSLYPADKNLELAWKNAYEHCEQELLKRLEQ